MPHTSVILLRSGTNRNQATEDLPDLPCALAERLRKELDYYNKKAFKSKKHLSECEVAEVRYAFFRFFQNFLKGFPNAVVLID